MLCYALNHRVHACPSSLSYISQKKASLSSSRVILTFKNKTLLAFKWYFFYKPCVNQCWLVREILLRCDAFTADTTETQDSFLFIYWSKLKHAVLKAVTRLINWRSAIIKVRAYFFVSPMANWSHMALGRFTQSQNAFFVWLKWFQINMAFILTATIIKNIVAIASKKHAQS